MVEPLITGLGFGGPWLREGSRKQPVSHVQAPLADRIALLTDEKLPGVGRKR